MAERLSSIEHLPSTLEKPRYNPDKFKVGIVHLGLGAFHRAHQAFYTDEALASTGGDWKILAVSMRNATIADQLNTQNGLYTLITKNTIGNHGRVIASIEQAVSATEDHAYLLNRMSSPEIGIVSLTITEKGYGIDRTHGGIDLSNPVINHDIQHPQSPRSAIGLMVKALKTRHDNHVSPFTILCCDNLPNNGQFVRKGVLDYASKVYPHLVEWIEQNVCFPSTMVDRITPAATEQTLDLARELTGHHDALAVETEPFHQWIIEDKFSMGRPDWTAAGAMFTHDVTPFEKMKLRMLNGAHSMIAYAGFLAGHTFVRDVMNDKALAVLVLRHMTAAASTLKAIPEIDYQHYASELVERFSNQAIAHATYQIASDGSQKLPQRIFEPAVDSLGNRSKLRPFAFATAVWMVYCRGESASGVQYEVHDPIAPAIQESALQHNTERIIGSFNSIPGLIPQELIASQVWTDELSAVLTMLREDGIRLTLDKEAAEVNF